jgi:dipeptidyl aminopeptidase/acylaminoacyl peptidase
LNLQVQRVPTGTPTFITSFRDRDVAYQLWKTNEVLLFGKDTRGDETYHLFRVEADGSGLKDLTPFEGGRATLLDELPDDPERILVAITLPDRESADVYRLNVRTGSMEKAAGNNGRIVDWLADHLGRVRIAVEKCGEKTILLHRLHEGSPFRSVFEVGLEDTLKPLLFTFDNANLYAASNVGRDKLALVVLDLQNGVEKEVLFEHDAFDMQAVNHSRRRRLLTSVSYLDWRMKHHFFDSRSRRLHDAWSQRFDGQEVDLVDVSTGEQVHLLRVSSDRSPGRYFLTRSGSGELWELADAGHRLPEARLRPMKPVEVVARDGLLLRGYLTLPGPERSAPFPAIVKVHGGPWQRDRWRYDPEVQFLASRGYAVLQLNFRGSTGYGKKFWKASFKEWGLRMQDDLTDGVRWLVGQGIADAERIGVYGSSYGGYAALAGLALTPDLYACGAAVSAPTDLRRLMQNVPARWRAFGPSLREMIGDPVRDGKALEDVSPAQHVKAIRAPLLMAHGRMDPRVPYTESLSLVKGLKERGVRVEWQFFEDEGHWIIGEQNRIRLYRALEHFFDSHLKPRHRAAN